MWNIYILFTLHCRDCIITIICFVCINTVWTKTFPSKPYTSFLWKCTSNFFFNLDRFFLILLKIPLIILEDELFNTHFKYSMFIFGENANRNDCMYCIQPVFENPAFWCNLYFFFRTIFLNVEKSKVRRVPFIRNEM